MPQLFYSQHSKLYDINDIQSKHTTVCYASNLLNNNNTIFMLN